MAIWLHRFYSSLLDRYIEPYYMVGRALLSLKENRLQIDKINLLKNLVDSTHRLHLEGVVKYSISGLSSIISSALGKLISDCQIN
mmetsp:Transcript_442/g.425  ORF Transcript_442/g.425 Transcript_442/m.425 type:complete len:85 (-) Transcript_442:217-471(-)